MPHAKTLFCLIFYEEYPDGKTPEYQLVELDNDQVYNFMLMFGNGVIGECRFECDSVLGIDTIRALTLGVGAASSRHLSDDEKMRLWLNKTGDECYVQAGDPLGYVFIDPIPHPEKFVLPK